MQNEKLFAHTNVDGKIEGRQFRIVLFGTAGIFHVDAWTERNRHDLYYSRY